MSGNQFHELNVENENFCETCLIAYSGPVNSESQERAKRPSLSELRQKGHVRNETPGDSRLSQLQRSPGTYFDQGNIPPGTSNMNKTRNLCS